MDGFYYLESSALIRLSKWLAGNQMIAEAICYTSFLSVFELLSGMTKLKYAQRVGVLRNLAASAIPIEWNTPREIMAESFAVVHVVDKLRRRVQHLLGLATASTSFDELTILSAETPDAIALDELSSMDVTVSSGHSQQVQDQIARMRAEVPPGKIQEAGVLLEGNPTFRRHLTRETRDVLLGRLGAYVAANMPGASSPESLLRVLTSYNGRADRFLEADALRQAESLLKGETPGRNDFVDVSHLLYLASGDQIVVTDDDLLVRVCRELFPTNYSTSADFLAKYR